MTTKEKTWHPDFAPSYTPMQMLDLGVLLFFFCLFLYSVDVTLF